MQFDTLYELSTRLSAGTEDVLQKFEVYERRAEKTREELSALRARLLEAEAVRLTGDMHPGLVARYEDLTVDDLFNLGKKLAGRIDGVIALVASPVNTVVLLSSGEPSCGALVKANAPAFGGKGGGRPDSARVFFPDRGSLDGFLESVLKQG
jgi:alanyl-tRNA synthetase